MLLYVLANVCPERLHVIYIDHQLQEYSAAWGQIVQQHCLLLSLPYTLKPVTVQHGNIEQQARLARYNAFLSYLNQDDVLVLAHHQQDQAETVMLRLLSGAGVTGLSAMREFESRHQVHKTPLHYFIWRPFLSLSKHQLTMWATQLNCVYVDDPMNQDQHYDRVWCRQQLWGVLESRFPKMQQALYRTSMLMQDAEQILQEVIQSDLQQCGNSSILHLPTLLNLSLARQRQVLSIWIKGENNYRPPLEIVQRLMQDVIFSREDAQAQLYYQGWYYCRYQQNLYRIDQMEYQHHQQSPKEQHCILEKTEDVYLACGQFSWQQTEKIGLSEHVFKQPVRITGYLSGEKFRLYARQGSKNLKKFAQDVHIAPWFRHTIQLLYLNDVILGLFTVKGFYLCESNYVQLRGYLPQLKSEKTN